MRARAGFRRLRADGGTDRDSGPGARTRWCALEIHTDGSGLYAIRIADLAARQTADASSVTLLSDEAIAGGLLTGLEVLGQHAWETGSAGLANIRARLWPVGENLPAALGHSRQFGGSDYAPAVLHVPPADIATPIDSLFPTGPRLVAVAAELLRDVAQAFGVPEVGQLDPDGRIRRRYWRQDVHANLSAWCAHRGIEVSDDTLPGL
jgi:hypothetical protein